MGSVLGGDNRALAAANVMIAQCRRQTPEEEQALYRGRVRYERGGYTWQWLRRVVIRDNGLALVDILLAVDVVCIMAAIGQVIRWMAN